VVKHLGEPAVGPWGRESNDPEIDGGGGKRSSLDRAGGEGKRERAKFEKGKKVQRPLMMGRGEKGVSKRGIAERGQLWGEYLKREMRGTKGRRWGKGGGQAGNSQDQHNKRSSIKNREKNQKEEAVTPSINRGGIRNGQVGKKRHTKRKKKQYLKDLRGEKTLGKVTGIKSRLEKRNR